MAAYKCVCLFIRALHQSQLWQLKQNTLIAT